MCKMLCYVLIFITLPHFVNSLKGQSNHFAYAVTAANTGSSEWIALRSLNTRTGKFSSMLLNMNDRKGPMYNFLTHKLIDKKEAPVLLSNAPVNNPSLPALNSGVAAIALDRKHNRIYYVPMSDDQLRYIDLTTMKVYGDVDLSFSKAGKYTFKSTSPITRLVITPDGYGYTITTENKLIRFTTNGRPVLSDQGALVDDPLNNEMTVLNPCDNAGGDLVADDAGNLYLITAGNRVYKIDVNTRVATYQATITGLPSRFTTNGAAVDENGQLIVSSSIYTGASFIVDHKTWKALPSSAMQQLYGIADLASSHVLHVKKEIPSVVFFSRPFNKTGHVRIYPNPVLFDEVNIQFNDLPSGNYTILLEDALGRKVIQQKIKITRQAQTEVLHIPTITAQAFYYIRILNEKKTLMSVHKLAVERW
ncbi:MAG TPA: T9SS type A sorting domain-containing protein [Niastella sp.]